MIQNLCVEFKVRQVKKKKKETVANIPPHRMPVLIPGATQQSGATKSKMARAIYHQCSCPITRGWDEKYALRAIKNPVCPVS